MHFENDILKKTGASPEEAQAIVQHFGKIELEKKAILHPKNSVCNHYFFLEKGLLRFAFEQGEKDETAWIVFENTFFTDIFSLHDKKPSFFEIVALENATVYNIAADQLEELTHAYPVLLEYLKTTWEKNFRNIAEIKLLQQFGNAKMRYEFFLKNEEWMKRVPQKLLASFIGITPYSLSRIRRSN